MSLYIDSIILNLQSMLTLLFPNASLNDGFVDINKE